MSALNEEDIDSKNGGAESKEEKAQSEEEGDAPTAEMLAKDAGIAIGKQVDRSYLKYVGREDVVELLEKFREECKDVRDISEKYFDDDMYCLRFIIGKDYDVEVAAAQFRYYFLYLRNNISSILSFDFRACYMTEKDRSVGLVCDSSLAGETRAHDAPTSRTMQPILHSRRYISFPPTQELLITRLLFSYVL